MLLLGQDPTVRSNLRSKSPETLPQSTAVPASYCHSNQDQHATQLNISANILSLSHYFGIFFITSWWISSNVFGEKNYPVRLAISRWKRDPFPKVHQWTHNSKCPWWTSRQAGHSRQDTFIPDISSAAQLDYLLSTLWHLSHKWRWHC